MQGWTKVYASQVLIEVKLAEDVLKQNGIESHILQRTDSNFPSIGEAVLYVLDEKAELAQVILGQNDILEQNEF